jgi:hypothetical protein
MNMTINHLYKRMDGLRIPQLFSGWQQVFGEARTRILLWYLLILGITFLIAIPAFRYHLYHRIDQRVRENMAADIKDAGGSYSPRISTS